MSRVTDEEDYASLNYNVGELDAHVYGCIIQARETERAAIVAWLRFQIPGAMNEDELADAIENLEHLSPMGEGR